MDVADIRTGFTKHKDDVGVRCQKLFQDFLEEFKEDGEYKYLEPMSELEKMERNSLEISFEDIEKYNQNLATTILEEYFRVYPYLCQALANIVKDRAKENVDKKEYYVSLVDVPARHAVRELKSTKIGSLVRFSGQVVRTHPVHPELVSGTFICLECQNVIPNVEQQFKFTWPTICRNPVCNNRRRFDLDMDKSVFVDFQKVKVQETQAELPHGSIPRSVDIILRAEIVETVQAGGRYDFTGTLIVVPDIAVLSFAGAKAETGSRHKSGDNVTDGVRGLKALGVRDLNYKLAFLACSVIPTNSRFYGGEMPGEFLTAEMIKKQMTDAEWDKVYEMSKDKNLGKNLVSSLFPSIYGNEQIKKGIILMLFGGVSKKTIEGTSLRGDINCIIIGDPSTAKSQLLKQVAEIYPRSVYTSGKASTAAGLTAAVVRDEESSDFVIEAGALLLADNGICCIDEFDKMDLRDQVAIHEAMEQQTISLAKAGIRASLNARTPILAAANPVGGRYDRTKSLQQNVTLSAPIMSRFDLFFVLLDECNEVVDYNIAEKIVALHTNLEAAVQKVYTQDEVLRYIMFAKQFKPIITPEAKIELVDCYNQLRQRDVQSTTKGTWRISVRQLESLIRLSEAMAKMECSDDVLKKHVEEAFQLLNKSIIRVEQPDINLGDENDDIDVPIDSVQGLNGETDDDPDDPMPLNSPTSPSPAPLPKKKLTLSFEEYKRLTNSIITYIRAAEEKKVAELEEAGSDETYEGIRKSEIIDDYLEKISEDIDTEAELLERRGLIEKVIDRLINHDLILIPLSGAQRRIGDDEEEDPSDDQILVVHPQYVPDV